MPPFELLHSSQSADRSHLDSQILNPGSEQGFSNLCLFNLNRDNFGLPNFFCH